MKLTLFLSMVTIFQLFATETYSQLTKLTLKLEDVTISDALKEIENQSEFFFLYSPKLIDVERKVNIDAEKEPIKDILSNIFGEKVKFAVYDRQIILTSIEQSDVLSVFQQQNRVTGIVTDKDGAPLPGVNIIVTGTTQGAMTDVEGKYSIEVPQGSKSLTFSFIGMEPQVVIIGTLTQINVTMAEKAIGLDEVVVVGYGTQRKITMTGSVASLNKQVMIDAAPTNVTNALAGRLPGLIVVTGNGQPGQSSRLSIRGASTFGDNTALTIVDGIVRDFDQIDPNEIETISILKDASATAVYGSRAANGVILVTTKRGSTGKPTFNYNGFTGIQQSTEYPKMMNAYEYAKTMNEGLKNRGRALRFTDQELADFKSGATPSTDWYEFTMRKKASMQTQHNINVSGGTEAIKYFSSIGYLDQDGMYDKIYFKRYSIRSNVDAKINPNLVISLDVDASFRGNYQSGFSPDQIFLETMWGNPTYTPYNPDGSPNYSASTPHLEIEAGYRKNITNIGQATLSFKQELPFIQGLSLSGKAAFGKQYNNNKHYMEPVVTYHSSYDGAAAYWGGYNSKVGISNSFSEYNTTQYSINLNYNRTFGSHAFTGLILFEQFDAKASSYTAFRTNFPAYGLDQLFYGGQEEKDANGSEFNDGRRSYVMRGNYSFLQRYLFEASLRIDGSVAFPTTKKYGFFPAFSVGWRISEEPFLKNISFIDEFKLRASYGEVGSDRNVYSGRIPTFQYLQGYGMSGSLISGDNVLSSIAPGVIPNPNITWESAAITNIGFDGSLWKSKLQFEIDLFYKRTSDILRTRIRSIPATLGASLPDENYAVVDNSGIEVSLTHNNNIGAFNFFVKANGGFSKSKVITLDEPANIPDYLLQTGRPLGFITGYKAIGFFQTDQEVTESLVQFNGGQKAGDVKYADINGDGKVDSNDQTIISMDNNTPKIIGGLTLGGSYRGFDFDVLFQGSAKVVMMYDRSSRNFFPNSAENIFAAMLDYWTPENPDAAYPRPWVNANSNNSLTSNLYLRDASYIRLKSVNIGYTLPEHMLNRIHVQKLRVYVLGTNLLTLKRDKGLIFDPEAESGSGAYYPQQRTYNVGVNLTF